MTSVLGLVHFQHCREYTSFEEFAADRAKHLIPPGSEFEWDPEQSKMFAWEVGTAISFTPEIVVDDADLPPRNIIGWTKCVTLEPTLTTVDAERLKQLVGFV